MNAAKMLAARDLETSFGWLLHFRNREPMEVFFSPPTTHSETLAIYRDAIAAEPAEIAANDEGIE